MHFLTVVSIWFYHVGHVRADIPRYCVITWLQLLCKIQRIPNRVKYLVTSLNPDGKTKKENCILSRWITVIYSYFIYLFCIVKLIFIAQLPTDIFIPVHIC